MRLVDADELLEHAWRDKLDSRELIAEMIQDAPTVKEIPTTIPIETFERLLSPCREHGEWEKEVFDLGNHLPLRVAYQCSCCNEFFDSEYNFCPHCGADMRGENK